MNADRESAEFTLLTGPLGSGKTTLLVDFLNGHEAADTGVIVNEAGAVNVDGAVLSTSQNGLALAHLPNGCICCSLGNDLHGAVATLMGERARGGAAPLRRIVLETSGLAHPGPILRSVAALPSHPFRLRILSTYDALNGLPPEELFPAAAAQLAAAQAVVVTKTELSDRAGLDRVGRDLARLNPLVDPIILPNRMERAAAAFAPAAAERRPPGFFPAEAVRAHPRVRVLLAQWDGRPDWAAVSAWLDELAFAAGDRLLRVKGLLDVADCGDTLLVESVGTVFGAPRRLPALATPAAGRRGLVLILRDTEAVELAGLTPDGPALHDTTAPASGPGLTSPSEGGLQGASRSGPSA